MSLATSKHVSLLCMPDDLLVYIIELLAEDTADAPDVVVAAFDSLAATCVASGALLSAARVWEVAAAKMGLAGHHHFSAHETLVRMTAYAELTIRTNAGGSLGNVGGMHSFVAPRGGGWLGNLIGALEPLGLAVSTRTASLLEVDDGDDSDEDNMDFLLPAGVPFVVVQCDAADPAMRPCGTTQVRTYPCAEARCMDPAAIGCIHCGKHGGKAAKRCVERVAQQLSHRPVDERPRRILFAAPSGSLAVKEAYRKAILGVQKRGTLSAPPSREDSSNRGPSGLGFSASTTGGPSTMELVMGGLTPSRSLRSVKL